MNALRNIRRRFLTWFYLLPSMARLRERVIGNYITILLYHEIDPDLFDSHLYWLEANYNLVPLRQIRDAILSNGHDELPPRCMVITLDDGWKSNYGLLPVVRKHKSPVTLFLTAGLVGTHRRVWNQAVRGTDSRENEWLKTLTNEQKDQVLLDRYGHYPEREYAQREMLSLSELEEMTAHFDFQSHSMFHPVLPNCTDEQLDFELRESKRVISQLTGSDVYAIAYPYGRAAKREKAAAMEAGYTLGRRAADPALNRLGDDRMALYCVGVPVFSTLDDLEHGLAWAGVRTLLHPRHQRSR